jgi:acyl carrier protein
VEAEIMGLLVEVLRRPGVDTASIRAETDLFLLGVDSLDLIQIAVRMKERFGVSIHESDSDQRGTFRSVRSLATFVEAELRARPDHA